ncbi:MAG: hypothetical protein WCC59_14225 [Terriglobales bacterium]
MSDLRGRALMEQRFGKLGTGKAAVMIGDAEYDLETALARLDLAMEDTWPMDIQETAEGNFCVRYYDGQDQRIVAQEFTADFVLIAEYRAHIAEWIGEDAYYESFKSLPFRCPLVPGDDF